MGLFRVVIEVANLDRTRIVEVEAIVDSGAVYTKLPRSVAERLGLTTQNRIQVRLGDNRVVERERAAAWVGFQGNRAVSMVTIGGELEPALLGATSLQELGLSVDSTNERLVQAEALEMVQASA